MDVWISRGCPRRKFFINRNILKNISDVPLESPEMLCHAVFETLTISFLHFPSLFIFFFFSSHLNCLSQTWSGVSQDMSDDQRLPVCGWFILNEKTLWSGLRAASNARHLQIIMIKHSNGTYSYPQTSHSLRHLCMHICRICWNGGLGVYNWCECVIRPNLWKWTAVAEIN